MKKFSWTNFNKIRRFLLNQDEFGANCAVDKHIKITVGRSVIYAFWISRFEKKLWLTPVN